jgi:hypothetical protein
MIGTPHRLLHAASIVTALVAALQTGCVIDTTSRAEEVADAEPEGSDLGAAADASSVIDQQPSPDAGIANDAEPPTPDGAVDAEVDAEDLGPPDPLVDPEDCAAICAFRAEDLPGWGPCQLEGFRTPGISYDCVQTCERAQAWASPFREAASACATQEPLCFESLEGCAIRNSESDAQLRVWIGVGGIGDIVGRTVGVSGEYIETTRVLSDFGGSASLEILAPIQVAGSMGLYLWVDDDDDGRCDLSRDRFALVWLPGFEQLGGLPEDHPLATFRLEMQVSGQREIWIEDAAQRLTAACDGHPR